MIVQRLEIGEGRSPAIAAPEANLSSLADLKAWADRNGFEINIASRITDADLPAIRQAVRSIDDIRARYGDLWSNPTRQRGLVSFDVGGPGVPGAAAFVKDRGAGGSFMSITRFDLEAYADAGKIGQVLAQSPYEAVVHEMGHVMSNTFPHGPKMSDPLNFMGIVRDARKQVWSTGRSVDFSTIQADLSNYAAGDDIGEFWGEAFTARNASSVFGRLSPEAQVRVNEFARLVNEKARAIYGLTQDVI